MNYLIEGPITQKIIAHLMQNLGERKDTGGHSVFLGQVRADEIDGKMIRAIEYSAYESMVKVVAESIKETILSEFADAKSIEIIHSTGIVKAGELSLVVMVSAGHRHHALEACSKTVELIKEKMPVWKKEIFGDDTHRWRDNNFT